MGAEPATTTHLIALSPVENGCSVEVTRPTDPQMIYLQALGMLHTGAPEGARRRLTRLLTMVRAAVLSVHPGRSRGSCSGH